ncbi:hypothetical protein ACM66B_003010 [Microbotryomycetes sp. NB124-2]
MSRFIVFKVTLSSHNGHEAVTRRIGGKLSCTFDEFVKLANDRFGLPITAVTWIDEDGDEITMTSEAEWLDMQTALFHEGSTVRLGVVTASPEPVVPDEATATPTSAPSESFEDVDDDKDASSDDDEYEKVQPASAAQQEQQAAAPREHAETSAVEPTAAAAAAAAAAEGSAEQANAEASVHETIAEDPPLDDLPQTSRNPRDARSSPDDLFELLAALPTHFQSFATECAQLFHNPTDAPGQLPHLARNFHDEITRIFGEVATTVRSEAERARADYEQFKEYVQREKDKVTSELESTLAEVQSRMAEQAREGAESLSEPSEAEQDERAKEERRQAARLARQREREAKQREAVREGKKADRPATEIKDDKAQEAESSRTTPAAAVNTNAAPGSSTSWYLPGSFSSEPPSWQRSTPTPPSNEPTPQQLRHALAELGFEGSLGVRIAAERAYEFNRGKSLQQMVQAAVEMLV